jgi:hypothetical protein
MQGRGNYHAHSIELVDRAEMVIATTDDILYRHGADLMTLKELEIRVATLEQKLASLSSNAIPSEPAATNSWIDQVHGTFQNDSSYRQAARLGRQWRRSQRPSDPRGARKAAKK